MSSAEITATLGFEARVSHSIGDPRKTPKGKLLGGQYPETVWWYCIEYELRAQWFTDKIAALVETLMPHKAFFHRLRATGGTAAIAVQFFSDGYLSDLLSLQTLAQMNELHLALGIECFCGPES
jgi:hypothetical protein